uniref:Uncharacterized protein n=1 Tax=Anguilla anguilla TaxID=7936 RepID=A0A0E9TQZ7_ANGAN
MKPKRAYFKKNPETLHKSFSLLLSHPRPPGLLYQD